MPRHPNDSRGPSEYQGFATTHWSVVLSTGQSESPQAADARDHLCRTYWPPIYSFIRRQGHSREDAQDLTQAFLAKLLEKNFWVRANPLKGRFRSFLLKALRNFLADERDRAGAAKRGGGVEWLHIDAQSGEEPYLEGLQQNLTAEQQYDRQWSSAILNQALERLRQECVAANKAGVFQLLFAHPDEHERSTTYADKARELGKTVSAIKSAVRRLRTRYSELLREEIKRTVFSPEELKSEIQYLLSIVGK